MVERMLRAGRVLERALRVVVVAGVVLAAGGSGATNILVDFDSDPLGNVGNGFQSVDSNMISFSDTSGAHLLIGNDPFVTGGSNALASFFAGDDGGIRIDFAFTASALSLDFGNDDPGVLQVGDLFQLVAYRGTDEVALLQVVPNANVLVDQTLSFDAGVRFDAVELRFTGAGTELIDNLLVTVIPEPSAAALFGIGALVIGSRASAGRSGGPRGATRRGPEGGRLRSGEV